MFFTDGELPEFHPVSKSFPLCHFPSSNWPTKKLSHVENELLTVLVSVVGVAVGMGDKTDYLPLLLHHLRPPSTFFDGRWPPAVSGKPSRRVLRGQLLLATLKDSLP